MVVLIILTSIEFYNAFNDMFYNISNLKDYLLNSNLVYLSGIEDINYNNFFMSDPDNSNSDPNSGSVSGDQNVGSGSTSNDNTSGHNDSNISSNNNNNISNAEYVRRLNDQIARLMNQGSGSHPEFRINRDSPVTLPSRIVINPELTRAAME
jgi:hypothetical protein